MEQEPGVEAFQNSIKRAISAPITAHLCRISSYFQRYATSVRQINITKPSTLKRYPADISSGFCVLGNAEMR